MRKQKSASINRRLIIITSASALLTLGAVSMQAQAASDVALTSAGTPMIMAETDGMDRRGDRRDDRQDDRQDDRGDRRDTRQDCRQDEGIGKDKRDCKQDGRQDRRQDG